MKSEALNEGQIINLVRKALLVAGHEMGNEGDHWPVVKSVIHQMMRDYEQLQIERNVDAELKVHLGAQLKFMESKLPECPAEIREQQAKIIKDMRDAYDACFAVVDEKQITINQDGMPSYIRQAEEIIATLEEKHA